MGLPSYGYSNLPPGGGYTRPNEDIEVECPNGHKWFVLHFFELGGYFPCNEDEYLCAECGQWAKSS